MASLAHGSRSVLVLAALLAVGPRLAAQGPLGEPPAPADPARPDTRESLDRREAVKLFGRAVLNQHNNRYLEAVRLYEEAARLDPEASLPLKALVPLYLALDRLDDALSASQKSLELDPKDHEGWHIYARQLRAQDRLPEAADALRRALDCPALKDTPELHVQIAFDLATIHEARQEYDKAEAAYLVAARVLDNPALAANPDISRDDVAAQAAETFERLGRAAVKAGHPDRATAYFLKARDRVKERDPARARRLAYNLAEVRMAAAQWPEALAALDEYLETQPQGLDAYRAKIQVLEKLGRRHEVLATLQRYAARDPHNAALRLLLAEQHAATGDPARAEALYLETARTSPGPEVYRGLFRLYTRPAAGRPPRPEQVLNLLNQTLTAAEAPDDDPRGAGRPADPDAAARARAMLTVLREDPALVRALLPLAQARLTSGPPLHRQTCSMLAVLAARTRQLDAAEALFRAVLRRPGGPLADREHEIYSNLLTVLRLAHKNEAIVELCRQGLNRPQRVSPVLLRTQAAQALSRLGRVPEALAEAAAAIEGAPDPARDYAHRLHAQILSQAGRHEEAAAEVLALLRPDAKPEDVRYARHTLSIIYSAARDHARSEEQLRLILRDDPNDATANNDLGYQWADQNKNLDEAEKLIRKALDLDRKQRNSLSHVEADVEQDNAAYIDSLGWVLFRKGQLDSARQELEKAAALPDGADDPVVWDHLADVYHRLGESARAAEAWRKAVELYEVTRTRPLDDRYRDLKQKLKLLESATQR